MSLTSVQSALLRAKELPFAYRHLALNRRVIRQVGLTSGMNRTEIKEHRRWESLYAEGLIPQNGAGFWSRSAPDGVQPKSLRMHGAGEQPTKFPKGKWRVVGRIK